MSKTRFGLGKISMGMEGMGVPDPDLWKKRAWELARIGGREEPNVLDWEEASRELHGRAISGESALPEEDRLESLGYGELGELREGALGEFRESESSMGEELVREGVEEAEHERMLLGQEAGEDRRMEPTEE